MTRAGRVQKGGKAKATKRASSRADLPDVYADMLSEALSSPAQVSDEGKTIKKRRIAGRVSGEGRDLRVDTQAEKLQDIESIRDAEKGTGTRFEQAQQQIFDESEDSEPSDGDWEDVDFAKPIMYQAEPLGRDDSGEGDLNLVLETGDREAQRQTTLKRKPITQAEKQLRVDIHKMHLLCLLFHVHVRNHWCNDEKVHKALKGLLSTRTRSYLSPDEKKSQFQRSRSFNDGLIQASETFREKFKLNARGMKRSYWAASHETLASFKFPDDLELPMELADFCAAAAALEGSRDTGAQLFCAMLRAAGVDVRLVCSLQPLPFGAGMVQGTFSEADQERRIATSSDESEGNSKNDSAKEYKLSSNGHKSFPHRNTARLARNFDIDFSKRGRPRKTKESPFPVLWVEAFNVADQKWIPVDPLVTKTVSKPSKFEPPASDAQNNLTYVLAFEDDGSARDVTLRYAQAYNAKTRKGRVEVTKGGAEWWRNVLELYRGPYHFSRDQIEDALLASREAAEPMPRNVLDFKDHPYYALERHLKRGEVIHPKREVGKVGVSRKEGVPILESVFRRGDVQVVKSADKWFRLGREIKTGEQPLKHIPARRNQERKDDESTEEGSGIALYSLRQTVLYKAPPVVKGRVPKNVYGNLDIYTPTMVPAGGSHILHPETARAARTLGIDYSDAVTGFSFKGRHGTAIINGAVIATEFREAVQEVLHAFEDEMADEEALRRSSEALKFWKRLLTGLRIRERINGYEIEGERKALDEQMRGVDEAENEEDEAANEEDEAVGDGGGGFFFDNTAEDIAEPTAGHFGDYSGNGNYQGVDPGPGGMLTEEDLEDVEEEPRGVGAHFADDNGGRQYLKIFNRVEGVRSIRNNLSPEYQLTQENHNEAGGGGFLDEGKLEQHPTQNSSQPTGNLVDGNMHDPEGLQRQEHTSITQESKTPSPSIDIQDLDKRAPSSRPAEQERNHLKADNNYTIAPPPHATTTAPKAKGPFADFSLPESELAEARMLQELHEANRKTPHPKIISSSQEEVQSISLSQPILLHGGISSDDDDDDDDDVPLVPRSHGEKEKERRMDISKKHDNDNDHDHDDNNNNDDEGGRNSNSSSDAGSLLSHDPEDDDADPEWIA